MNKKKINKYVKNAKNELGAFKTFVSKGNVVDMAVGVVIGGAFSKIVTSLVNDIITPLIGILIGGLDFSSLNVTVGQSKINYGSFIQTVIDFLIVAICIYSVIRLFEKFKKKLEKLEKNEKINKLIKTNKSANSKESTSESEDSSKNQKDDVKKAEEILLLEQIRDLLKESKTK